MDEPENELLELAPNQAFGFACGPHVPCFNACCRDLNQFLAPYDILRLKTGLNMASGEFLARYTQSHAGPSTGLPVRTLVFSGPERKCCFLTREGCSVYDDRPSSCRAYPLVRMASRNRATGRVSERWFLLEEAHCQGACADVTHSPAQWVAGQGLLPYNRMNDRFMEVLAARNRLAPGSLSREREREFALACYNLDRFAELLGQGELPDAGDSPAPGADGPALLDFALDWIIRRLASPA